MKKILLVIASLFLAINVASASPTSKVDFTTMSKVDSEFLFDGNTNVIALSSQEMKETEGEFVPLVWAAYHYSPAIIGGAYSITRAGMLSGTRWGASAFDAWATVQTWLESY